MPDRNHNVLFFLLLIALFLAQFLFISPLGEFALNDDWVHTDTIKHWVETGEFRMLPYAGPSFYVPILYGSALVKLFGFSFSVLRLSTLILTMILVLVLYVLIERNTKRPLLALCASLTLWLNPVFYNLSFTFMTDIPALLFLLFSFLAYWRGLEQQRPTWIYIGSVLCGLGFYTRQTNILPLIIVAILILITPTRPQQRLRMFLGCLIPGLSTGAIYLGLLMKGLLPESLGTHVITSVSQTLAHMAQWTWEGALWLGLWLLPLSAGWLKGRWHILRTKPHLWMWLILCLGSLGLDRVWPLRFWHVGNIFSLHGLGPIQVMSGQLTPLISPAIQTGLTILGALGAGLLIIIIIKTNQRPKTRPDLLGYIFMAGYGFIVISLYSFDRYFLPVLLLTIIYLSRRLVLQQWSPTPATFILLVFAIFSVTQTHHYLSWNQARWELAGQLAGIPATHIDGGYEWIGWRGYWIDSKTNSPVAADSPWWIEYLFTANTRTHVVSFSPLPGYSVRTSKTLKVLNPNNRVYLLERTPVP